jgi:TolA-binding protein
LAANYVEPKLGVPAWVHFSDGSQIAAAAGSRLRIDATHVAGARILVEHGTASVRVAHRTGSNWVFVAGPFDVRVTGTKFTLKWDPEDQALDLTLHEGSVEVQSPLGSSRCQVRAGQRFRASLTAGTMYLENTPEAGAPAALTTNAGDGHAPDAQPAGHAIQPLDRKHALTRTHAHASKSHALSGTDSAEAAANAPAVPADTWPEQVRRGAFQVVVDAAMAQGVGASLASCTAEQARALADAARYTGHFDVARRSLSSLRTRFAGTRQSAAAAFLLGRIHESSGSSGEADAYYRTYLKEAPDGEFAADALAGHMRAVAALQGAAAARPIALEYLRRYRAGVHADMARRLTTGN